MEENTDRNCMTRVSNNFGGMTLETQPLKGKKNWTSKFKTFMFQAHTHTPTGPLRLPPREFSL